MICSHHQWMMAELRHRFDEPPQGAVRPPSDASVSPGVEDSHVRDVRVQKAGHEPPKSPVVDALGLWS